MQKYIVIALFLILLYIAFLIVKPFVNALLASFILAFMFHPVYQKINNIIKKPYVTAVITTLIIIVLIVAPLLLVTTSLVREALILYQGGSATQITNTVQHYIQNSQVANYLSKNFTEIVKYIAENIGSHLANIPMVLISLIITVLSTFFMLLNGKEFVNEIKKLIPFKQKDELVETIQYTTKAVINGFFIIAIIEFIISFIGLSILHIKGAIIFSSIIAIVSMMPLIGPFIILLGIAITEILNHNYMTAIGLGVLYLVLAYFEFIIRPKIIGTRAKIHPLVVFIGIVGGIHVMGFIGTFIGPLILSVFISIVEKYYVAYIKD